MFRVAEAKAAQDPTPLAHRGWASVTLAGWGRVCRAPCLAARPERMRDLHEVVLSPPDGRSVITHGGGRSYGDVALNTGGAAVVTRRLDRMLDFDPATGLLVTEPGVTFADLLRGFLPRGFAPPVAPGTGFATLGGAIANDVHGKNHHHAGSLGDHLEWIEILLADGRLVRASAAENADLFYATIGGIGLTGVVTTLCLRLMPVPSNALLVRRRRISDLDEFLAGFEEAAGAAYSVGWIDAMATGAALGRGTLEMADPLPDPIEDRPSRPRRVPFDMPRCSLNRLTVRAFNELYWRRVPVGGQERQESYARFLHPLDALLDWNRLYGKAGFHQFQCVVPFEDGAATLRRLLEAVAHGAAGHSPLAVLKSMGQQGRGLLSFPRPGWTLAIDLPARSGVDGLFARLERITREAGGRIYLAKDAMLSATAFDAMYPNAAAFRAIRAVVDPDRRFQSDLARRVGLA
jgi:decaprenylphospho-beta-D-ribofuranose 2-oxidase